MRMTFSRSNTNVLPSPIFPVLADFSIAAITRSSRSDFTAASTLTLGRKSTTYSAPRYNSVWPFCRPNPLTSVTVMPCTPIADSASRTSSSLNGLMIALTSFIRVSSESLGDRQDDGCLAGVSRPGAGDRSGKGIRETIELTGRAVPFRIRIDIGGAEYPAADVLGNAHFPIFVVGNREILHLEHAEVPDYAPAAAQVKGCREIEVLRALGIGHVKVVPEGVEVLE